MNAAANFGWDSLRHGGLLLDPERVSALASHAPSPLPAHIEQELRRLAAGILEGNADVPEFVTFVLQQVCGFASDNGRWFRGSQVSTDWSRRSITNEAVRPRQLWLGREGGILPVFIDSVPRIGQGRGRKASSQVLQWLRAGAERLALLTNGRQWRLIYSGLDFDAWCEWDLELWFEQGALSPQVTALRTLLSPALWKPPGKDAPSPLLQAILDSRKGQAELSAILGERVREAVEILVQAHGEILKERCGDVDPADIYRAAVRVVMRLVVGLFAESRDLLPRDVPSYNSAYGIAGLREDLEKTTSRGAGRLATSHAAWPRVLSLFRLIYSGSDHPDLLIPAYGGELFARGDAASADGVSRALAVFETACFEHEFEVMADLDVHRLLERITRTRTKIRQGRASTWVSMPVDFTDLRSEYIGILYEGLLDFELRTAPAGDPIIFLAVGNEPALPLSRLEEMDQKALSALFEKLKDTSREGDEEAAGEEGEEVSAEPTEAEKQEGESEAEEEGPPGEESEPLDEPAGPPDDARRTVRTRAETWARRAVLSAKLVRPPRGSLTPEKRRICEDLVGRTAHRIVSRVVLPGEWFLVRWGGTRKGAGTFYTRPGLAVPTVHRTLRPLAYDSPLGANGKPASDAPPAAWTPKKPEEILALKICDPACGSGTFPVAALRFLTDALYTALHHHGRLSGDIGRPLDEILGLANPASSEESLKATRLPCRPDDADFELKTKAVLRRYVAERSIYGVDLDPLAVELSRLSLWVETMDRSLPFTFLDHKIKCGNSLVGAWFDQFRHYPVMAWKNREGGDKNHTNGVHFAKETRTKAIKAFVKEVLAPDLRRFLANFALFPEGHLEKAESAHAEAVSVLSQLHDIPEHEAAERSRVYRVEFLGCDAYCSLKAAMDLWCACWFWPADELTRAPIPTAFASPPEETSAIVSRIAAKKRFFHWELEFPDVFRVADSGFDAMLGNPPWETLQPNSKEYFSNIDPLYRSYGKQEALRFQTVYFGEQAIERGWMDYTGSFAEDSNWMKNAAFPFGDPDCADDASGCFPIARGKENDSLHERWRSARSRSHGFSLNEHPFRYRGKGKAYTYKLFLEQVHALLRKGGRFGFVVPSGLYSDHGTGDLRRLYLDRCSWEWLFGFENREKIFEIDSRFKFNPVIIQKGGSTEAIRTAFMRRKLEDWERGEELATPYSRAQVERFSPKSRAILEIQSKRDLDILEKIYANSVLLGDEGPDGWGIKYAQGDFNMTSDSKLFPPRPWWEERGYRPDEYSRWLKGDWRPIDELWKEVGIDPTRIQPADVELEDWLFDTTAGPEERQARAQFVHGHLLKPGDVQRTSWRLRCAQPPYDSLPVPRADIPAGIILSREADAWIREEKIEDTALPLYQGVMIWIGKPYAQICVSIGRGKKDWKQNEFSSTSTIPKYLISVSTEMGTPKVVFRDISNATNERTIVAAVLPGFPCGNVLGTFYSAIPLEGFASTIDSLVADWQMRQRVAGTHLNLFVMNELATLPPATASQYLSASCLSRNGVGPQAAPWALGAKQCGYFPHVTWRGGWALTPKEALRNQLAAEALAGALFGLDDNDLRHILKECDYASATGSPKGFWRVDKDKPPELRHTVMTIIAFLDLAEKIMNQGGDTKKGMKDFIAQNFSEGWMIPETARLKDYGLGYDERASFPQPVSSRLGARFFDWQLAQMEEESWQECHLHAHNLLGDLGYNKLLREIEAKSMKTEYSKAFIVEDVRKVAEQHGPLFGSRRDKGSE